MLAAVKKFFGSETDMLMNIIRRQENEIRIMTKRIEQLSTQRVEPVHVLPEEVTALYSRITFLRQVIKAASKETTGIVQETLNGALIVDDKSKV